ncbi:GNAT family N-acetyltransferase [Halalkalibacter okhensis]|uniref:GNAT family acetyltransferase n=1 Tax=Halalkalibacter okhensis TaxID=333138 RepID=A0A0B0IFU4_9BACI|nr:GNAT family N-acetyltransferase [Halalkalibacter okhensis]KHF38909.1 GNAT family acetyltransferase [Halalkalibacter okhensis]
MIQKRKIRKATLDDIANIQNITKITWNQTYEGLIPSEIQDKFIESAYSNENMEKRVRHSLFLVATVNDRVIGFANFFLRESEAILGAMYISPNEQGKGFGSEILAAALEDLKGVSKIYVEVENGNKTGEAFYQAKGFSLLEEYEDDFYGHILKTKRMVLDNSN